MTTDTPVMRRANGIDLACLEAGEGPLVVLLHGFPDTATSWDPIRATLAARGFHVVAPYLRGYDPSGIPDSDATAEDLGRDVLGLLDDLDVEKARIVGHDWGALAAHAAVGLAEERFSHLATLAIPHPAGFKPGLGDAWRVRHFAHYKLAGAPNRFVAGDWKGLKTILARWSPTWDVPEDEFDDLRRAFSKTESLDAAFGYYRALSLTPPRFLRKKLSLATLAICGEHDGTVTPSAFETARSRYKGAYEVAVVPAGHFPHRECTEQVTQLLVDFLETAEAA